MTVSKRITGLGVLAAPTDHFYTYGGNGNYDAEHGVFNAIGKPYTEDNQRTSYDNGGPPELGYIHGGRHGGPFSMYNTRWNGTSYPPSARLSCG